MLLHVLPILYQDRNLVVVYKPAGLPTIPPRTGGPDVASLTGLLVCHRLDTDTTGCLVLARSAAGQRLVSQHFEARRVEKGYLAVAVGELPSEGECRLPLGDWSRGRVAIGRGKEAHTAWKVLGQREGKLLVQARPTTGRTHQIRAHLSASGAPLVGDEAYGGPKAPHVALHAWWIVLPWPGKDDRLRVVAEPPPELVSTWGGPIPAAPG